MVHFEKFKIKFLVHKLPKSVNLKVAHCEVYYGITWQKVELSKKPMSQHLGEPGTLFLALIPRLSKKEVHNQGILIICRYDLEFKFCLTFKTENSKLHIMLESLKCK